ncbi:flagellin N-terminal helical domain-containing protein [Rhizobium sp. CAU 1783]
MTSILTNNAAMAALQTLRSIDDSMERTQARVSSGLRVGTASDNAAYWSIATTMRSDNMALSAVQDALGLGAAKVDTAYSAMETAVEVVKEIKAKMVAATEEGVDRSKIQEEIAQLQEQLRTISSAASFSGENWLQADLSGGSVYKNVVGSFVRAEDGSVSVKKIDYELNGDTVLFDTVGDTGILDRTYNVSQNAVTLDVNTNGVVTSQTVAAYTIDQLIGSAATFTTNTVGSTTTQLAQATADLIVGGVTVITNGSYFVQADADTWVLATDVTGTGQEALHDEAGVYYGVDTANLPATNIPAPNSIDTVDITTLTNDELDVMVSAVDRALETVISASSDLGSIAMRIGMQEEFVASLTDSIDSGIGRLVDADMNEESTRLKALQTQQQLAIQSLSIANTASENILTLFR